jgi:hypothetical protein
VRERYGEARYQEHRNAFHRNGRELFLIELGKWGLGRKDLVANVNFFSKVTVDDAGDMHFVPGHSKAGDSVDLRAEMDTLVVLNTCPHPLDPAVEWSPKPMDSPSTRRPRRPRTTLPHELPGERPRLRQHRHLPLPVLRSPMNMAHRTDRKHPRPAAAAYDQELPAGEPWLHELRRGRPCASWT